MRIFCQKFLAQFLTKLRIQTLPWNLLVYRVDEIAQLLAISPRAAYNLCNTTKDFRVVRIGTSIRVNRESFEAWFAAL